MERRLEKIRFRGKRIKRLISDNQELSIGRCNYKYSAVVKNLDTGDMEFSRAYYTTKGLNKYFLNRYDVEVVVNE